MLSNKINSGSVGVWFLVAEHLRLGTWDLLKGLTGKADKDLEPRIAMQLINESATCRKRIRQGNYITNQGFEILNGMRLLFSDEQVHNMLNHYTMAQYTELQKNLIRMRKLNGHYKGEYIAIDPHHINSTTKRIMPKKKKHRSMPAKKSLMSYFSLDAQTGQPISFTISSSGINLIEPTLQIAESAKIISDDALILADKEHYNQKLFRETSERTNYQLLVPAQENKRIKKITEKLNYKQRWTGYAVAEQQPFTLGGSKGKYRLIVQREGLSPESYKYKPFLTISPLPEEVLMGAYMKRWTIEDFFNMEGALGFDSASTFNLNIIFGKMNMALFAQAAIYQFRQKIPEPFNRWDAVHMADAIFRGLDGDIRVKDDTIVVTCYNTPAQYQLQKHYTNLPKRLEEEGIDPRIPWLFNFKLDFRFK